MSPCWFWYRKRGGVESTQLYVQRAWANEQLLPRLRFFVLAKANRNASDGLCQGQTILNNSLNRKLCRNRLFDSFYFESLHIVALFSIFELSSHHIGRGNAGSMIKGFRERERERHFGFFHLHFFFLFVWYLCTISFITYTVLFTKQLPLEEKREKKNRQVQARRSRFKSLLSKASHKLAAQQQQQCLPWLKWMELPSAVTMKAR